MSVASTSVAIKDSHPPTVECPDEECAECGARDCPFGEGMHYHHDGCATCWMMAKNCINNPEKTDTHYESGGCNLCSGKSKDTTPVVRPQDLSHDSDSELGAPLSMFAD